MRFNPFISPKLLRRSSEPFAFDVPVQLSLFPEAQPEMNFALRLHDASRRSFDFRIQVLSTLFSLVLVDAPSLNPEHWVKARLMMDDDPRYLDSERVIPEGSPGAGPTMPVDVGKCSPIVRTYSTYEMEMLDQISRGDLRLTLNGRYLRGGWKLSSRSREFWILQKLEDEFASATEILSLTRSVKTGATLDDLRGRFTSP